MIFRCRKKQKVASSIAGEMEEAWFSKEREGGVVISDTVRIPHPRLCEWIFFEVFLKKL